MPSGRFPSGLSPSAYRSGTSLGLAVLLLAAAGCQSTSTGKSRPQGSSSTGKLPPSAAAAAAAAAASDAELERRAQAHAAFAAGVIRQMRDDGDGMLRYWTDSLTADPGNVGLAVEVARRRIARREYPAAITLLEQTRKAAPAQGEVEALLGLAYLQSGQRDQAVEAYRRALGVDPDEVGLYPTLTKVLVDGSRLDEAMALLKQAEERAEAGPALLMELAELYGQLEQREPRLAESARTRALAVLDRVAATQPKDPLLLNRLGDRYSALGKKPEAEKFYQESRTQAPRNPMAAARLAEIYLQSGRLKEASQQLEALRREDPTNPIPLYFLGLIAFEGQEYDRAADFFQKCLLLNGTYEPAHLDLISALLSGGKPAEGLEAAQRARTRLKPTFRLEFLTALAHGRLKQYEAAFERFQAAEAAAKESEPARIDHRFLFQVGAVLEEGHREELAEQYLRRSLELKSDFAPALNHLGYMWADKGVRLDESRGMIEQAVKLDPKNAAYLDSLGWVLFKLGRPQEALGHLQHAAELLAKEPDATVLDHIGDALAALKRWPEAKEAWQKSLAIEPSDSVKQKLEAAPQ